MGLFADAVTGAEEPATPARPEAAEKWDAEARAPYEPYERSAVQGCLAPLDQKAAKAWTEGDHWDTTTYEAACNLLDIAHSPWSALTVGEAEQLVRDHAPTDDQWTAQDVEDKIDAAHKSVSGNGRATPVLTAGVDPFAEAPASPRAVGGDEPSAEDTDDDAPEPSGTSWGAVDVGETVAGVIAGTIVRPAPTVGRFEDGRALFYRGKVNGVAGASNAGKSWTGFYSAAQEIRDGHHVVYVDLEDDLAAAVTRLLDLGVDPEAITERFHYVSPEESYTFASAVALNALLDDVRPTLVVVDSTGESLALDGAKPNDDDDVARWFRRLPTPVARRSGAAVVILDHVVKAEDGGMWPIGSQRKRAAISGAQYMQVNVKPFDRTTPGHSKLVCAKDRHGNYRAGATVAMLNVTPSLSGVTIALTAPAETSASGVGTWRPTGIMEKISRTLEAADGPLSFRKIDDQVSGKAAHKRTAIEELVKAGHLLITEGPRRSHLHTLVKPYDQRSDPASDLYDRAGHTQPPSDRVSVSVSLGGDTGHTHSNRVRTQSGHGGDTVSSEGLDGGLEPSPAPGAVGRSAATAPPSRTTPIAGGRWHYDHATGRLVDPATGEITEQVDGPTSSTQNTTERTAS